MFRRTGEPATLRKLGRLLRLYWRQTLVIVSLLIVTALFFPRGKSLQYSYQLDEIAREPIIAPFNFPILKTTEELQADLNEVLKSEPFLFVRQQAVVDDQIGRIERFFQTVRDIRQARLKLAQSSDLVYRYRFTDRYEETRILAQSDSAALAILTQQTGEAFPFLFQTEGWERFLNPLVEPALEFDLDPFKDEVIQTCRNRWAEGIYDVGLEEIISEQVAISQVDEVPILTDPSNYNDLQQAWIKAKLEITNLYPEEYDLRRDFGYELIVEFMKPNLIYDKETTERRQKARQDRVPLNKGIILKDERIVDANTRITTDVLEKLNSLSQAITRQDRMERGLDLVLSYLGRFLVIGVVVSFFFTFLLTYRTRVFEDWKMILLIAFIFILELGLAYFFVIRLELSEYLIPVAVAAMVLTIMFDARIGFMGTTSIALLVGILIGNNVDFIVTVLFTSSIAVLLVRRLRNRAQLFGTIFALIGSSVVVVLGYGLFMSHAWKAMGWDMLYLTVISILAPIITYGLIGILEIPFGITTDLTLLELLDFQHPLLKRLQQEANGTFNHSVVVGNLAEGCADAIGAHALLCRVGAYYHDIGKVLRPEYFIENQYTGENKHDNLTPVMSAKIIKTHVSDGLKLAAEYNLPQMVTNFIPMHHGTSRVEYFYRKALHEAEKDDKVDESTFRYRGPKPNTKETGILMLCEAIEAAVRSLKEPDILKIETMIDKVIDKRIAEGQLSECPLTLDELRVIKGTVDGNTGLLPILRGIYHIRIEYPEEKTTRPVEEVPTPV